MPAPTTPTYSVAALVAAQTAFKTLIDAGASAGSIRLYSSADVLLATAPLSDPCGTVDALTGQLTLSVASAATGSGLLGTVAYATVCDSTPTAHLSLPAITGSTPVAGYLVMTTLSVVDSGEIAIISATIG